MSETRKLAAILVADVVGYSRLTGADEERTLARLRALRSDLIDPAISVHHGRVVKRTGDGSLIEFRSVVDAVRCAVEVQSGMIERNAPKNIAEPIRVFSLKVGLAVQAKVAPQGQAGQAAQASASLALPDKPSIAVLPFENMSGDPDQDHFCDGLVEDIITTLSKLGGLRVIARNSSFVYKGRSVDVREAGKQLCVQYVLEGSVRKSGNRIRVTAQLIDAQDGSHLWAERYDRAIDDIFAIQDEITLILATEMRVKLTEGEEARLHYTTTHNVGAWICWVQGLSRYREPPTKETVSAARVHWEKALDLDPTSAALNAMLGFLHVLDARFGWWEDRETALGKARRYTDKAFELEPGNADAYRTSSCALLMQGRYDEAVSEARKSVQLAPGSAEVAELASFVLSSSGFPEEGTVLAEKAIALNPNYPALYLGILGNAYRLSGRHEEAIAAFKAYNARQPGFGLIDLVIAYQEIGQAEEAKRTAERALAANRNFTIASWQRTQFRRDRARLEADLAALRAAGLR